MRGLPVPGRKVGNSVGRCGKMKVDLNGTWWRDVKLWGFLMGEMHKKCTFSWGTCWTMGDWWWEWWRCFDFCQPMGSEFGHSIQSIPLTIKHQKQLGWVLDVFNLELYIIFGALYVGMSYWDITGGSDEIRKKITPSSPSFASDHGLREPGFCLAHHGTQCHNAQLWSEGAEGQASPIFGDIVGDDAHQI